MGNQRITPAQKVPKLILVLFFLFLLVIVAEGAYYLFYSQKFKIPGIFQKGQSDTKRQLNVPTAPEEANLPYQDLIEKYPISAREGISYLNDEDFNLLGEVVEVDMIEKKIMVRVYDDVLTAYYNDSTQKIIKGEQEIELEQFSPKEIRKEDWISFVVSRDENGKFILKFQTQQ